jgi:hypothetical protein
MKENYDMSKARKNPYAQRIRKFDTKTTVIREYFRTPEDIALSIEKRNS